MSLSIVILNYRTPALTIQCLDSIAPRLREAPDTHVILIDNNSPDDSVPQLHAALASRGHAAFTTFLPLPTNLGFAVGNNAALPHLRPSDQVVLFLNSDTIVHDGALALGYQAVLKENNIGAAAPLILNPDGSVQNFARKFPTPLRLILGALGLPWKFPALFGFADLDDLTWDRRTTARDVDWLGGAALFVRRKVIDTIGPWDPDFFFTGEDVEWCHRMHRHGYRRRHEPAAAITHLGGASSDPTKVPPLAHAKRLATARHQLQKKLHGTGAAQAVLAIDQLTTQLRATYSHHRRGPTDPRTIALEQSLAILRSMQW